MNRNLFLIGSAVLVLVVVFLLGSAYGSNKQKHKVSSSLQNTRSSQLANRWTALGTIVEVSDSQIKVKDSRNQEKTAAITKDTKIVNRQGDTLKPSDLKKDQRVITSGEKDGDKLTAI